VFGGQFRDWTADYALYAKDRVEVGVIFNEVRRQVEALGAPERPLCVALDDTILRKVGKCIPGTSYRKDPLGPAFNLNLVWAQRRLQISAAVADGEGAARMIPGRPARHPLPQSCRNATCRGGGNVARVVHTGKRTQVQRYRQVSGTPSADLEKYTVNDLNQIEKFQPVNSIDQPITTRRALFTGKGALTEDTLKLDSEGGTPTHVNRAHDYFYDSREKAMTSDGWVSGVLLRDDVPEALADIPLQASEEGREFDADGNPETSGSTTFVYDAENRLIPSGGAPAGAHDFFWGIGSGGSVAPPALGHHRLNYAVPPARHPGRVRAGGEVGDAPRSSTRSSSPASATVSTKPPPCATSSAASAP